MPELLTPTGRIVGTRITVYDVLDYAQANHHPSFIAATLSLSSEQVAAALEYAEKNRDAVMKEYEKMRQRDAQGNAPDILAKIQASHAKLQSLLNGQAAPTEEPGERHPRGQ